MPQKPQARRFRFDLSFLLFWVMPYVALAAALTTWTGPYSSGFLNRTARTSALIGLTIAWITLYASRRAARRDDESSDPPSD
jgi:hypothetical protein